MFSEETEESIAADLEAVVELVEELKCKKLAVKAHEEFLEKAKSDYAELERKVLSVLDAAGLEKFVGAGCSLSVNTKSSWRVPKDPESRSAFFDYLRDKGIFDEMITVHSQTLNSWANAEQKVAAGNGQFDFRVPGLGDPVEYRVLSVRMSKE